MHRLADHPGPGHLLEAVADGPPGR